MRTAHRYGVADAADGLTDRRISAASGHVARSSSSEIPVRSVSAMMGVGMFSTIMFRTPSQVIGPGTTVERGEGFERGSVGSSFVGSGERREGGPDQST